MTPLAQARIASDAPVLFLGGVAVALLIVPLSLAMALDTRLLEGVSIWAKPVKFALALTLYLLTLAYFARLAPAQHNRARRTQIWHAIVIFCVLAEMLWIGGAAMFGTTSHFNVATPLMSVIYPVMGLFAVTLTAASLTLGLAILRTRPSGLPLAVGASLIATFVLTCLTAGYMSSTESHFVGGTSTDLMPLMGWARDMGDLRAPHFLATHILHIAPALALAAFSIGLKDRITMLLPTLIASALAMFAFVQAIRGAPFLPWIS